MRKSFATKFAEMVRGNLVSRLLGFLREVVVAAAFGASRATDIFAIAFTIPTLFRRVLGEDMVEKAFLPPFRRLIAAKQYRHAWILASRTGLVMLILLVAIMALCYLLTPQLVRLIGAGLNPAELAQAETMTYVVLPFMVAIGLAAFVGGLLLFLDATAAYAFAPVFLSVGVIIGVLTLKPSLGMYSIGVGFVFGGFLQFVFQVPILIREARRSGLGLTFSLQAAAGPQPESREVRNQSGWILLQSVANKSVEVVERLLASFLVPGSVAALYFAQRLVQLPNAIVGLAIGRAGVTELNDQVQQHDWQGFRQTVTRALRYNLAIMLPVTAFAVALAKPATAVIFQRGAFDLASVNLTALAFSFYALGLAGMGFWALYTRIYPALAKNQVPLYSSLACALVNIGLDLLLVRTPLRHGGLALGSSIAITLNGLVLFYALNRELRLRGVAAVGWQDLSRPGLPVLGASVAGGLCAWLSYRWLHRLPLLATLPVYGFHWGIVAALALAFLGGLIVFFLVLGYWANVTGKKQRPTARVLLTGGGTGGHVNPALAIAEEIRRHDPEARFLYVGVHGRPEAVIVTKAGYPIRYVRSRGYPGLRPSAELIKFAGDLLLGTAKAVFLVALFRPSTIIGTGGYGSAPVVLAATFLRLLGLSRARIYVHEQNSVPGSLNRLVGRWADKVMLTFPQSKIYFPTKGVVVGYPVRRSLLQGQSTPAENPPIPPGRKVIFVFGGSQGARTINRALIDALRFLLPHRQELFVIHGVGLFKGSNYDAWEDTQARLTRDYSPAEREQIKTFYWAQDYFHAIGPIYAASDLVVCRGGAGSLNEISAMGKPALIIPKANLPGDHQVMNARAMQQAGAAEIIYEDTVIDNGTLMEKVDGAVLASRILALVSDPSRLQRMGERARDFMRQDALKRIMAVLNNAALPAADSDPSSIGAAEPLLGNSQLLALLQRAWLLHGPRYRPEMVISSSDDLAYYRHRAAALLLAPDWQTRNLGVKLIGLLHHRDKLASLLVLLEDRTPAPMLHRLLGGDFRQVGFIRRNILTALQLLDHWDQRVEAGVKLALADPYYEVRAHAARVAAHFSSRLADREWFASRLRQLLRDKSFEVAAGAAASLGTISDDPADADLLLSLGEHHYWQVREAALRGILSMLHRGVADPQHVRRRLSRFVLTMTDFKPHFRIRQAYWEVLHLCLEQAEAGTDER